MGAKGYGVVHAGMSGLGSGAFRRLLRLVAAGLVVTLVVFLGVDRLPGDAAVIAMGDLSADVEAGAGARRSLGLEAPVHERYLSYLAGLTRADFGTSQRYGGERVGPLLMRAAGTTGLLTAAAAATASVLGLGLAFLAVSWNGAWPGALANRTLVLLCAFPPIVLGVFLAAIAGGLLRLAPAAGWQGWSSVILPSLSLGVPAAGAVGRMCRQAMLETMEADFIRTARAKGAGRWRTVLLHALPNSAGVLCSALASMVGGMIGGSLAVEEVFAVPGLGRMVVEAVLARDQPVVAGAALVLVSAFAAVAFFGDLLVDGIGRFRGPSGLQR